MTERLEQRQVQYPDRDQLGIAGYKAPQDYFDAIADSLDLNALEDRMVWMGPDEALPRVLVADGILDATAHGEVAHCRTLDPYANRSNSRSTGVDLMCVAIQSVYWQ